MKYLQLPSFSHWPAVLAAPLLLATACGQKDAPPAAEPTAVKAPVEPTTPTEPKPAAPKTAETKTEVVPAAAETPRVAEPPSSPTAEAKAPGAGTKPKRGKPDASTREKAVEARRQFNRLLEEGRKAVKADDPLRGMQLFEEALGHLPGHPKALGEFGWAAFRAGEAHYEKALDATRRALEVSQKPAQKGALHYNLGRIHEARGNLEVAARSYRTSLGLRPGNDIVAKQLAELEKRLGEPVTVSGYSDLDGVCAEIRELQDCGTATSAEGIVMHSCECSPTILGPAETFGKAALVQVTGTTEAGVGMVAATYLAVENGGRWSVVSMVANDWTPGMGYVYNSSTRRAFEFVKLDGRDVLWVMHENQNDDLDPGVYTSYSEWSRTLIACEKIESRVACYEVTLGQGSETSKFNLDDEEIPEGMGPEKETKERWAISAVVTAAGAIEFLVDEGAEFLSTPAKELPGTRTWNELKALKAALTIHD